MLESFILSDNEVIFVLPRGGTFFPQPFTRLGSESPDKLTECAQHWPFENTATVKAILQSLQERPHLTHWLACETAFFSDLPAAQKTYAIQAEERAQGYTRFGADGLFHSWATQNHPKTERFISIHLCENTTLAAIHAGKVIDCSTGYSLLEGLPGLTTCGDLDPSLVGLLHEKGFSTEKIGQILYQKSGWQSISPNITFTDLVNSTSVEPALPQDMYVHALIKGIGAMLSILGGADLVFCGCEKIAYCKPFFEKIRTHFAFTKIKFELSEVNRETVLMDSVQTFLH
jgi:acetate kinase